MEFQSDEINQIDEESLLPVLQQTSKTTSIVRSHNINVVHKITNRNLKKCTNLRGCLTRGRFMPFILWQRPHALQRQWPVPSLLHSGVSIAPQLTHSLPSVKYSAVRGSTGLQIESCVVRRVRKQGVAQLSAIQSSPVHLHVCHLNAYYINSLSTFHGVLMHHEVVSNLN